MHTILVLGGYGFFGGRIASSLATDPAIRLLIGGRSRDKAEAMCVTLKLPAGNALAIDTGSDDLVARLIDQRVDTLIHTAGPFQGQDYAVPRAAIAALANHVDLADGRDFVAGIPALRDAAQANGVTVISGASSVPALSSAVVDRYAGEFARLDAIRIGISSGARSPGLATVSGVFSYCGKPVARWNDGRWVTTFGWLDLQSHRFPEPVGRRLLGSCDVPDLALFPQRYPSVRTVTFHAGFANPVAHLGVWGLAQLVRGRLLPNLVPWSSPLNRMSRILEPVVSDKGGMFVELAGLDRAGNALRRTWHLITAQNHGPYVPCGAAIALARKFARGENLPKGAMPCIGLLSVEDYLDPLRDLDIREVAG